MINKKFRYSPLIVLFLILSLSRNIQSATLFFEATNLTGSFDSFTYTDSEGVFTTSDIALSLKQSGNSYKIAESIPGNVTSHLEIEVSFNDPKNGS